MCAGVQFRHAFVLENRNAAKVNASLFFNFCINIAVERLGCRGENRNAIKNLIVDGYLLCTMAQNPDVMGSDGVKAAVEALDGKDLGGEVVDTGVSVLTAKELK